MASLFVVQDGKVTQSADQLVWQIGENTITFPEPFADTTYTFQPDGPSSVLITEKLGSRTPAGVIIILDVGTTEGRYIAIGPSSEFTQTSALDLGVGVIQTGSDALVAGRNTIIFPVPFTDTTYIFTPIGNATNVTIDMASKTINSIDVIMADDDPDFQWQAIGA